MRGATLFRGAASADEVVSIHAPVRGATQPTWPERRREYRFNPRAREGRDLVTPGPFLNPPGFNPRAREGRDQTLTISIFMPDLFQSTRP